MRRVLTVLAGIVVAALALTLTACTLTHLTFYIGGPDYGLDLVVSHSGLVDSAPGGCLWDAGRIVYAADPYMVILSPFAGADPGYVGFVRSLIEDHPHFEEQVPWFEPEQVHDPGAVAWIESCEWYVDERELYAAAQYLRGRGPAVREAWDEVVTDRALAVTGWGALLVAVVDGAFTGVEYQPADSRARLKLEDLWHLMEPGDEYADHPEANGRVEAALLDENPPTLKGTYTLGVAFRFY
ncbi:MAG TPA: hypothetical protein VM054_11970 [bacterium]|nr:hypothetical protein [bacterium]